MNEEYILQKVGKYLRGGNKLSKSVFSNIFHSFSDEKLLEISTILHSNGIEITDNYTPQSVQTTIFRSSGHLAKLSNEQLCVLFHQGNEKALNILCKKNYGFVYSIAKRFKKSYRNKFEIDDLINCGYLGFIKAVRRFDITGEYKLLTYAVHYIMQSIRYNIAQDGLTIRIPINMFSDINSIVKQQDANQSEEDIFDYFKSKNYSDDKITTILSIFNNTLHPLSLNAPLGDVEDDTYLDTIESYFPLPDHELGKNQFNKFINESLSILKPRARQIIEHRFGLSGQDDKNLQETGIAVNLTRERVRQIAEKSLEKLNKAIKPRINDHYWD